MMGSGRDREIRYGEGSPWFDIVLPCGGGITLTLHKLRSAQPLLAVLNRTEQRKPVGLRYDPQAQSLVCLPTQTRTGWNLNGFEVGFRPCVRLMIYGRSLEAQATASLAAATGYDSHIFDLFRPQPALRSIPIRRSFCCAMISTGSCQCCRPREKQNPFISAHWAAIEPTRYVCKSSTSWDGPGGNNANPGTRRDIPQSPGCAYSGTLRAGRSRLCTSPSGGGFMPAPVVLILAAGRGERFLASGEIPISVSAGVSPRRLRLIAGHLKKTGELSTLRLNRRLRLMICV